jgi:DtxR family Mn-dependent transcriptional regulator
LLGEPNNPEPVLVNNTASDTTTISPTLEDYLETISNLVEEQNVARVSHIAKRMGVQMPSVTGALKHLAELDLVNYQPYQYVTLTGRGEEVARATIRRHNVLRQFIEGVLGLPSDTAERDACGMEHALSEDTVDRLVQFLQFIERCPRIGKGLLDSFRCSCEHADGGTPDCDRCIEACLREFRAANRHDADAARQEESDA